LATSCATVGFFVQLHPSESSIDGVAVRCVRAEARDRASRSSVPARCARCEWFDDGKRQLPESSASHPAAEIARFSTALEQREDPICVSGA
jgi:hypothetical protein